MATTLHDKISEIREQLTEVSHMGGSNDTVTAHIKTALAELKAAEKASSSQRGKA